MNHCMENHFNVVVAVSRENSVKENTKPQKEKEVRNEYKNDARIVNAYMNCATLLVKLKINPAVVKLANRL